jgi:hypothetical protein
MAKKYVVRLSAADRTLLTDLITAGKAAARAQTHARLDEGKPVHLLTGYLKLADQILVGVGWRAVGRCLLMEERNA